MNPKLVLFVADENTIRITNLPPDTTDDDLKDICGMQTLKMRKPSRLFLARDKTRDVCKVGYPMIKKFYDDSFCCPDVIEIVLFWYYSTLSGQLYLL